NILNIGGEPIFDDRIVKFEFHTYNTIPTSTHVKLTSTLKLINVEFYLNSKFYPYDDLNLDFDKHRAAICMICIYNTTVYCLIIHDRVIEYSPKFSTQDYVNYHYQKNSLSFFLIYEIKSKIFCDQAQSQKVVYHNYTNVCGSARIYRWKEICREGSGGVEKSHSLSLYFYVPMSWNFLTKSEKYSASCLSAYHHGLQ
ncbi:hypothetical protein ALC56_04114, partial [Trachymyrmex septentrionalis]